MEKLICVLTTAIAIISIISLGFAMMMINNLNNRIEIQDRYIRSCNYENSEEVINGI
jgi:hypothetical protein